MNRRSVFGQWLVDRRKECGLTHHQLATAVCCSVPAIRKYESGERRPHPQIAHLLAQVLDIPADQRPLFLVLAASPPSVRDASLAQYPGWIPTPPTKLIGRSLLLATAIGMLQQPDTRLLTLLGAPGIGKTRIALDVALHVQDYYTHGACFVALAPLRHPADLPAAVLMALGIRPISQSAQTQLLEALRQRHLLLLLDNCEHLLRDQRVVDLVSQLLAGCPALNVLATSRIGLLIRPEQQLVVPPLGLPERARWHEPDAVAQAGATAFFLDRVRAINPDYVLSTATAATIADICQRLDGLPLALELIAARAARITPVDMLAQLDQRLPLLTDGPRDLPARHATLTAAIDWSYAVLPPVEQDAFARLGVFVGGCTSAAAAAVGASGLENLCATSLLQQQPAAGTRRYTLLETVREFALEQLAVRGAHAAVAQQHAAYFAALARDAQAGMKTETADHWLAVLDADIDNIRAALRWSLAHDRGAMAGRIGLALFQYWRSRGLFSEGARWMMQALEDPTNALSIRERADLFRLAGFLQSQQANPQAQHAFTQSLALYRSAGDLQGAGRVLTLLGMLARYPGNASQARTYLDEAYTLLHAHGLPSDRGIVLEQLGLLLAEQGDYAEAEQYHRQSLDLCVVDGIPRNLQFSHLNIAQARWRQGDYAEAQARYQAVLTYGRANHDRELIAIAQSGLGRIALHEGDVLAAQYAYAESLTLADAMGIPLISVRVPPYSAYLAYTHQDYDRAEHLLADGLLLACQSFAIEAIVAGSIVRAACAAAQRQDVRAARFLATVTAISERCSLTVDMLFTGLADTTATRVRRRLGTDRWTATVDRSVQIVQAHMPTMHFPTVYDAMGVINLWNTIHAATGEPDQQRHVGDLH